MPLISLTFWSQLKPHAQLQNAHSFEAYIATVCFLGHKVGHNKNFQKKRICISLAIFSNYNRIKWKNQYNKNYYYYNDKTRTVTKLWLYSKAKGLDLNLGSVNSGVCGLGQTA